VKVTVIKYFIPKDYSFTTHRENGPAVITKNGFEFYYKHGLADNIVYRSYNWVNENEDN